MPSKIPLPDRPGPAEPLSKWRYARGADLSNVPKAADTPPADLSRILAVDTANPYLRQLRIQQGLLKATDVDPIILQRVPMNVDSKLRPQITGSPQKGTAK
jgi:hypothetical protein